MIWKAHIHVVSAQEQDLPPLDLYCGDANCYDGKKSLYLGFYSSSQSRLYCYKCYMRYFLITYILLISLVLGMTRDSPRADISKAYRKLAGKWHPDRFRSQEEKDSAEKKFLQIAAA